MREIPEPERITRFELARREGTAALLALAFLILAAVFLPVPIRAPMGDPTSLGGEARAPWFFLWVQQLLKWGNPFLLGVAAPLVGLALFALLPYLFPTVRLSELGRWFPRRARLAQIVTALLVLLVLALTTLAMLESSGVGLHLQPGAVPLIPTPTESQPQPTEPDLQEENSRGPSSLRSLPGPLEAPCSPLLLGAHVS